MTRQQRDLIRQAINQHARQRVQKFDAELTECLYCGGPLPKERLARRSKYCSDNHRRRAWNKTPQALAGARIRHARLRARKRTAA